MWNTRYTWAVAVLIVAFVPAMAHADMALRWSLELPLRQTKWLHVKDMQRDTTYRAAAAGELVFVGCEHNGALLALDAKTGQEQWRFYTGGAIRTQPAADAKHVLFGSDDGFAYCLGHNGKLRWKAHVGQGQRFVIGHQRLTSAWPVPTHPLLTRGKLYIMGGCWPADGVFMNCFDAASGKRLWKSPSLHMRPLMIPHWIHDGHVYVRTYSGTGGKAGRFDIETGIGSYWPKETVVPVAEKPNVPGAKDVVGSNASGGLVFATGKDGTLYCAGPALDAEPKHHELKTYQSAGDTEAARQIIALAGHDAGYALVTKLTDGSLVEGLLRASELYVVAVDADEAKVNRIRRDLDRRGCFDERRLTILAMELSEDMLPPYFASIVLCETGDHPGEVALQSLRPYGGAAMRKVGVEWKSETRGPLAGAGNWSHEYANASMNNSTGDKLAKAPLGILWYGGPASDRKYYLHGNRPAGALIVDGRMFLQGDGVIAGIDAYTGRLLWEAAIPTMHIYNGTHSGGGTLSQSTPWDDEKANQKEVPPIKHARATGFNWAAASDCIYVFAAEQCLRFDPATGKPKESWVMPLPKDDGEALCWGHPRVAGDILVATAFRPSDLRDAKIGSGGNGGDWTGDRMPMSHVFAVDRETGKLIWSHAAHLAFNNRAFVAAGNRVFCTDLLQSDAATNYLDNGRKLPTADAALRAFDLKTGKEVWNEKLDRLVKYINYIETDDLLLVPNRYGREWTGEGWGWPGLPERETRSKSGRPDGIFRAFRGETGELVWQISEQHYDGPYSVIGDRILNRYGTAFDPKTGKLATRVSPLTGEPESFGFKKSGCAVLGGCDTLVAWRTGYHDMRTGTSTLLPGFEAGCTTSLLPAGGMLNMPNFGMFHLRARAAALSMVHRPCAQPWGSFQVTRARGETPIRRIGYNLGAPGDRYDEAGTLWVRAVRGGRDLKIDTDPKELNWYVRGDVDWIGNSGVEGEATLYLPTALDQSKSSKAKSKHRVRLFFAEPSNAEPGERVFDVALEGETVLEDLDIARSGEDLLVREFDAVEVNGMLEIGLTAKEGQPVLCGVELIQLDPAR